jgi:hypothetical protein
VCYAVCCAVCYVPCAMCCTVCVPQTPRTRLRRRCPHSTPCLTPHTHSRQQQLRSCVCAVGHACVLWGMPVCCGACLCGVGHRSCSSLLCPPTPGTGGSRRRKGTLPCSGDPSLRTLGSTPTGTATHNSRQ